MLKHNKPFESISELSYFNRLQNMARIRAISGEKKYFKFHKDQKKLKDFLK